MLNFINFIYHIYPIILQLFQDCTNSPFQDYLILPLSHMVHPQAYCMFIL